MKMIKLMRPPIIFFQLLIVLSLAACKKNPVPDQQAPVPLQKGHGAVLGNAVTKVIGASGGSIASADGNITVEIPAGAVSGDTPFSIQPIEKSLDQATGSAFRLGPENITFQKDVKITFKYSDEDLDGSAEDYLYLTYQDKAGYFYRQMKTGIDKANKTLFVNSRHFSDWYIERVFSVIPVRTKLYAGQQTDLLLFYLDNDPYGQVVLSDEKIKDETWFVNGPGTVTKKANSELYNIVGATYKAPASIVSPTTVAVGAQIKNMVDKLNPDRVGTSGLVIVQAAIDLVPDEYIIWEFNGVTNTGVSMDAAYLGTMTSILGNGTLGAVNLVINTNKTGTYELGSNAEPDKFDLTVFQSSKPDVIYQGSYSPCNEPKPRYGKGKVVIDEYGNIGGFIVGSFSAMVYTPRDGCQPQGKLVTGNFRLRRKV